MMGDDVGDRIAFSGAPDGAEGLSSLIYTYKVETSVGRSGLLDFVFQ